MISYKLLGLLPISWILLQQALVWLMRRTGALDRPPSQIGGRRSFRRHPAVFLSGALVFSAVAADLLRADWLVFGSIYAALGAGCFLLLLGQRYVLSEDRLEMQIFGRTRWRVALSDVARVRPAGFWRRQTPVRQLGKELPLPNDMPGVRWLTRRIAPQADPAPPRPAAIAGARP